MIEFHEDWQDQPSGKKLVLGTMRLDRAGRPAWVLQLFPQAVVLATQPYWLLIKATRGQAIWLLSQGNSPVRILKEAARTRDCGSPDFRWPGGTASSFRDSRCRMTASRASPRGPRNQRQRAPTGTPTADYARTFDLTTAMSTYLANQPSDSGLIDIPLSCTALVPGIITIYPPRIEYSHTQQEPTGGF